MKALQFYQYVYFINPATKKPRSQYDRNAEIYTVNIMISAFVNPCELMSFINSDEIGYLRPIKGKDFWPATDKEIANKVDLETYKKTNFGVIAKTAEPRQAL